MNPEARRSRGTSLCRRLTAEVARLAPPDIGGWDPAWAIVAEADASFIIALSAWEVAPTEETLEGVRSAYRAVLKAWQRAGHEFLERYPARGTRSSDSPKADV